MKAFMSSTTVMTLDDEMLTTVSGGFCATPYRGKGKKRGWSVRQSNTQTFTAGDISLSVGGDLSGSVFIGNSASNSVGSEPA